MAPARQETATTASTATERTATERQPATTSKQQGEFTCPECGKTFTRAASLGAHRKQTHGVAGASTQPRRRTRRRSRATTAVAGAGATRRTTSARRRAAAARSANQGEIDRDRLLQTLFPNGLPAREEVIQRANAWLDEAEQLARAK